MSEAVTPAPVAKNPAPSTPQTGENPPVQAVADDVLDKLTPQQIEKVAAKLKIKVKDGDIEEEVEGLDNIRKLVQLRKASDRRFNDAHKKEQALGEKEAKLEKIVGLLTAKDERVLAALGVNPVEFAEEILRRHIEAAKMTPEQRRAMQTAQERDEYRARLEAHQRQQEEAQAVQATEQAYHKMSADIETALKNAGTALKMTPYIASRVARFILRHNEEGRSVSADDAVRYVLPQIEQERREMEELHFRGLTPEQFEKAYPEKAEEFRKYLLGKASAGFPQAKPPAQGQKTEPQQPRRRGSLEAFMRDAAKFS